MHHLLLAFLDKAFKALATVCSRRFSSQTECECGQDGALPAPVFAHDEVDQRAQLDREVLMAHEIVAVDTLYDPMLCRNILLSPGVLLVDGLGRAKTDLFLLRVLFCL